MRTKIKTSKKVISLTDDMWDKVEAIRMGNSFLTTIEAIRYAITVAHKKEVPAYIEVAREKLSIQARTPEEKADIKLDIEEAKSKAKEDREAKKLQEKIEQGRSICINLRGKEKKDASGNPKCTYYSYSWLNTKNATATERSKYLDELTLEDADFQFYKEATSKAPKEPMDPTVVIATLVDLGMTDEKGIPK